MKSFERPKIASQLKRRFVSFQSALYRLRLIERLLTPAVMLEAARMFLVDPAGREQSHYAPHSPAVAHGDEAVLRAQQWLAERYADAVSVTRLAAASGLGERTFLRRFKAATGDTPIAYLQRLRVGQARELLELSAKAFDDIAWQVGYEDAGAFRKIFQRLVGITPGEYRRRFAPRRTENRAPRSPRPAPRR